MILWRTGLYLCFYFILLVHIQTNKSLLVSELNPASSNEDEHHSVEPSKPKKKMPKRKRGLSYQPRSSSNQKSAKQAPKKPKPVTDPASATVAADPQVLNDARIEFHVSTRGATSKMSNAALKSNLKSSYKKLNAANSNLAEKDKQIEVLTKKNQDLTDAVRSNRQMARTTKTTASGELKQATSELKLAQHQVQTLQDIITQKDTSISKLKEQYESQVMKAVSDAVEKEKVNKLIIIWGLHPSFLTITLVFCVVMHTEPLG